MLPLKVGRLTAPATSLTIGRHHREILQEKLEEFTELLQQRKHQLEEEFRALSGRNGAAHDPEGGSTPAEEVGSDVRPHLQQELDAMRRVCQQRLDYLFHKFEREWQLNPTEKANSFPLPKSGAEAIYLGEHLGDALGRALAEICVHRPTDPIEYLGLWLKKYSDNVRQQREEAIISLKLRLGEEEALVMKKQQELMAREREQIKEDEERRRRIFLEQAKQIEGTKDRQKSKTVTSQGDRQENASNATKRVTVLEPEADANLYTIAEKESISGVSDDVDSPRQ